MEIYTLTSGQKSGIDYGAKGRDALIQTATFLLSLHIGTCPMNREEGWDPPLDDPAPLAQGKSSAQIIQMLERSLPELTVQNIEYTHNSETGEMVAHVKVVIEDDEI